MSEDFYPYKVQIPKMPEDNHEEVLQWMIDSIEDHNWTVKKVFENGWPVHYVCFSELEDAVAFKTVWYPDDDSNK